MDSPLAQGVYHPNADRLELKGGEVFERYFRDRLGIRYFAPLDKERHPLPPAGWCSWYYYYRQITPEETRRNAERLAEKLRDYGLRYVQLDDGWQADGDDPQTPRDWSGTNEAAGWSEEELHGLAEYVRELGMLPGIWIAPHGQSNDSLARRWGCFLMEEDGSSGSVTWVGRWLLDPSHPRADQYLRELFRKMKGEWDFTYFKIDGQPTVLAEYAERSGLMVEPGEVEALYRGTVQAIREEIGDDSFLLGCWGTPLAGMGLMSGSRTGEDVVLGGDGFRTAFRTMLRWGFLNNIAWYGDPDVVLLRPPLPIEDRTGMGYCSRAFGARALPQRQDGGPAGIACGDRKTSAARRRRQPDGSVPSGERRKADLGSEDQPSRPRLRRRRLLRPRRLAGRSVAPFLE